MKKTKLLTSLAALALVLGLGACEGDVIINVGDVDLGDSTDTSEDSGSETSSEGGETTPEPTAYAIVGDFVDNSWNESPATDSIYYIPLGTETYEVTVTIANEPTDNEYWTEDNHWAAGLRVVNYGTWDLALGSDDLAEGSEESLYGDDEKNIKVEWATTYDIVITFGETNSILVTVHEEAPTTIESLTFVVTLYDSSTNQVQACKSNGYISYSGTLNGTEGEGGLVYGEAVKLTETTDSKGQTAYTTTFTDVLISNDHTFTLTFYYNNANFNSSDPDQTLASNVSSPVPASTASGDTLEFEVSCVNIDSTYTAGDLSVEEPPIAEDVPIG